MSLFKKTIIATVSRQDGTQISTLRNFAFGGFDKELNGGVGECVIQTDAVFDDASLALQLGNDVEIRISDKDTATEVSATAPDKTIYRGYISMIERGVQGQSESVIIHVLGYYTLLATDILKDSTQTKLYSKSTTGLTTVVGDQNAADIGLMMRTVIDRYRAENASPKINYIYDDIPNTSTTVTYTFNQKTYREILDTLKSLAPANTYWKVDAAGNVSFKTTPTTPTHRFIFGRHFTSVRVEQSMEKIRNFVLVWDGTNVGTYKHYQDDDSILTYGRRVEVVTDYGIEDSNAADAIGAKFLAENKDPDVKVVCKIMDNNGNSDVGYDIESIEPGDTCSFYGFAAGVSDNFRDNMIITRVNYQIDYAEIEVQLIKSGIVDVQGNQEKMITDISGSVSPETYT